MAIGLESACGPHGFPEQVTWARSSLLAATALPGIACVGLHWYLFAATRAALASLSTYTLEATVLDTFLAHTLRCMPLGACMMHGVGTWFLTRRGLLPILDCKHRLRTQPATTIAPWQCSSVKQAQPLPQFLGQPPLKPSPIVPVPMCVGSAHNVGTNVVPVPMCVGS